MIIPILKNANSTTPGDPVLIAGNPQNSLLYITSSADYAASGTVVVVFEHAKDASGPWEQVSEQPWEFGGSPLGNRLKTTAAPGGPHIWYRARLSAAPSAGSLSVDLFAATG